MCAQNNDSKPNVVISALQNKCPRCRRGKLYAYDNAYNLKHFMKMNNHCAECGQPFDMEVGFYYGTSYVSYALALTISGATFVAWWLTIHFSLYDNRLFWWLGLNAALLIALQPPIMRVARTIWLYFFVYYSKDWYKGDIIKPERINEEQMNNW